MDIIYVSGFGRSGSTLVESLLQKDYNAIGLGELYFIWDRGFLKNEKCTCGTPFRDCSYWSDVLKNAFGAIDEPKAKHFDAVFKSARGNRPSFHSLPGQLESVSTEFKDISQRLYGAINETLDGQALIDSSKYPLFGAALSQTNGLNVKPLHVFRDPRAVAHSWSKKKKRPEGSGKGAYMSRSKLTLSSIWRWKWFNHGAEQLGTQMHLPYLSVCYEDFCDASERHMKRIAEFYDLKRRATPFSGAWHSVSGNPARFEGSLGSIRKDEAWKEQLPGLAKIQIDLTCMTQFNHMRTGALTSQN
ncbi:MAG: hypothetical protein K5905_23825 [Roseibium sp.]|uniref:hypothetical protein n=1 Tax=Roseibium sp. TaxID=1936156 RepID=UPI0026167876|nr:hypothetical protein [Roseibium sp.]MCV0428499.1 hypothetical protein [Roseibium sp.]